MKVNQHIIVTGGAGFIGSALARRYLQDGFRVTILDDLSTGRVENIPQGADFVHIDLGQEIPAASLKNLSSCTAIFHLAGQSSGEGSFKDPLKDLRSHVLSTLQLLEWAKSKAVKRFMYASSMSVYGDPINLPVTEDHPIFPKTFYGVAKYAAEQYIQLYGKMGLDITVFRLFSVYGPGQNLENRIQGMASIFLSYMLQGEDILVRGDRNRFRDFVFIDDVVEAWVKAYQNHGSFGKIYNVATNVKTTVGELIDAMKRIYGDPEYPVIYQGITPGDQFGIYGDYQKIKKDLGWHPRFGLNKGLEAMIHFEKSMINTMERVKR